MSKQIRMACALLDLLRSEPVVTVRMAVERIEYDENSLRQALRVLVELQYAKQIGGGDNGRTKLFVAGPKLARGEA